MMKPRNRAIYLVIYLQRIQMRLYIACELNARLYFCRMIERFSSASPKGLIKKVYGLKLPAEYKPVYNASAKIGKIPVITADNPYRIELMNWGLMPFDSEDPLIATKLTNARFQTLQAKQPYCDMLEKKRCVVLTDGFFVWKDVHGVRTPYRVVRVDGSPFPVAALWDSWKQVDDKTFFKTFSMITIPAFDLSKEYNDRMPAILSEEARLLWLDDSLSVEQCLALIKEPAVGDFRMYKVSNLVDNPEINISRVVRELNAPSPGDTLNLFG